MGKIHTSLRIEKEYLEKIERIAEKQHIPVRTAMRSLLAQKLDEVSA